MKSIWKYDLTSAFTTRSGETISTPKNAKLLDFQIQHDRPVLWAMVDPEAPREERCFVIKGTGWDFEDDGLEYIATAQQSPLVWHLFEATKEPQP